MDLAKVLFARMYQSTVKMKQGPDVSRFTHWVTGETRNFERRLWVDVMIADHIPHTRDDQNQTIGG